jgi:hypothetical protein
LNPHPRSGRRLPRRRAGALRSRRPLTRWAPFLLLLLSLGIAATAIYHTAQASRSHRATAEGLIRDYAAFAAWNLRQHVSARIRRSFDLALEPSYARRQARAWRPPSRSPSCSRATSRRSPWRARFPRTP